MLGVVVGSVIGSLTAAALVLGPGLPFGGDGSASRANAAGLIPIALNPLPEPQGSHALATLPELVNFQGVLTDTNGVPVTDGTRSITFRVYDAVTGGNVQWQEKQNVTTQGGLFHLLLGSVTPLTAAVFNGTPRYLEVQVQGDSPLVPRQQFVTVPYAFHAGTADSANSADSASKASLANDLTCSGCVDSGDIADGTVTQDDLASSLGPLTQTASAKLGGCADSPEQDMGTAIVTLPRSATVLMIGSVNAGLDGGADPLIQVRALADGAQIQQPINVTMGNISFAFVGNLAAGTHTLKVRWSKGGFPACSIGPGLMNVLVF